MLNELGKAVEYKKVFKLESEKEHLLNDKTKTTMWLFYSSP